MVSGEALTLADLIFQLRGDLNLAAWQGEGKGPRFVVGPIELELSVVVDTSRQGSVAAKLVLVDVSAGGAQSSQVSHRVKLTLRPVDEHGHPSRVSSRELPGEE